jgi:glyoxylase-like metal-dependent hydrolase (beta-lactamase superfamily II)
MAGARSLLVLNVLLLCQACSLSDHHVVQSNLGKPSSLAEMERLIDVAGPIEVETINSADDGSAFAISVPGHTPGSTAYVLRTPKGPILLTGDTCHTRWGWEHSVEPGSYTADQPTNRKSLLLLEELVRRHPAMDVRLGHQY